MLIELEEPFKSVWAKGYLRTYSTGRKYLDLVNSDVDRTTISYARYLMCVKLGHFLSPDLEVDHKDDDFTNDSIDNLQVLTPEQNKLKQHWNYIENVQVCYGCVCAFCGLHFLLTESSVKSKISQGIEYPFCSRSCSVRFNLQLGKLKVGNEISEEKKSEIKNLRANGFSSYQISEVTGISRNTIMKYW